MPDVREDAALREHGEVCELRAGALDGALHEDDGAVEAGARGVAVRRALIGYLRWSSRRHWTVKVATMFLLMPVWLLWPSKSDWDKLIDEAFLNQRWRE